MKGKQAFTVLSLLLVTSLTGCMNKVEPKTTTDVHSDSVFILYTGDVNCQDDENIGYGGLYSYKLELLEKTSDVYLIDTGDALEGDFCGAFTEGSYITDLMNEVGYDLAVLGNHEFDYGLDALSERINESGFPYISSNVTYTGSGTNKLSEVSPYVIKSIGDFTFGFVGATTPTTFTKSTPTFFMEDGEFVYDFATGNDGQDLYDAIQESVDACLEEDVDFVILCSHLGDSDEYSPYSSLDVLHNTYGIDICLDSQCDYTIDAQRVKDVDGNSVLLCSSGSDLEYIGQLEITTEGKISHTLVSDSDVTVSSSRVTEKIDAFNAEYEELLSEVLAYNYYDLIAEDEDGVRMVRNRETNLGDIVADAYRSAGDADIGIYNGGAIENTISHGQVTLGDVIEALPYLDAFMVSSVKGQDILDALELSVMYAEEEYRTYDFVTDDGGDDASGDIPFVDDDDDTSDDDPYVDDDDDFDDYAIFYDDDEFTGDEPDFGDGESSDSSTCTCPDCVDGCECECEGGCDGECDCECDCPGEELDDDDESEYVPTPTSDSAIGEFGGFLQVSGISFDVNVTVQSPVVLDEHGLFVEVDSDLERRVSNVYVGDSKLDPGSYYTVASIDYILRDYGNGYTMFDNATTVSSSGSFCYEVLAEFLSSFDVEDYEDNSGDGNYGSIPAIPLEYETAQGRINFKIPD